MLQINKIELSCGDMLEKIIPIYDTDHGKMINARELHHALGIKKKFADWIKMYVKDYTGYNYGLSDKKVNNAEEYDYFSFDIAAQQKVGRKREYYLSLDIGKEIAMMTRSAMGKEVRKYFISAEKTLVKMNTVLTNKEKTSEEKIAEALLLSQEILARKNLEIKRANRNKAYNKKVNVNLRREIRKLKKSGNDVVLRELLDKKEEEIEYMEGNIERLRDQNIQLRARINHLITIKVDGKSILNALALADVGRRQKFAINEKSKEQAKINAYVFRKEAIANAGIILNSNPKNSLVDNINTCDMEKAVIAYVSALRNLINDSEIFNKIFGDLINRVNVFLNKIEFEKQQQEEEQDQILN